MQHILVVLLIIVIPALISWPLGRYLAAVMDPGTAGHPQRRRLDTLFRRLADGGSGQTWSRYLVSLMAFNTVMLGLSFLVLMTQQWLPLNPDDRGPLTWDLALNTAVSFTTNTNLQHYSGEVSMSYFSQLFALMWLQFVSCATGLAALAALARGLAERKDFGNFYVDLQRATFTVLLPLAVVVALLYIAGGMPMTLDGAAVVTTLEGTVQNIARGPVAVFVAIKQLGTNGGGFFGPNSTHPFENPNFFTNAVSMMAIILLPMASVWMFGRITGKQRHAAVVFGVMMLFLVGKAAWAIACESEPTAAFAELPVDASTGNLEGKELRFGPTSGPLWAALTTCTSNGSVDSMHNSLNPLAGLAPLVGMWLNATFGGAGVGMVSMFVYITVSVFLAGMMIGRTPEYMGKRIESREVLLASICLLAHPLLILGGTALFASTSWGMETIKNAGPRGFTEILYEFSSASANNGSGYEGLGDNTVPWNVATALVMFIARFLPIILPIAIAGWLAAKRPVAETAGTLRTDTPTFGFMLAGVIILLGALTFFPVAILGPVVEHLLVTVR